MVSRTEFLPVARPVSGVSAPSKTAPKSFADWLKESVETVTRLRSDADAKAMAFARGEDIDIHSVMLAAEHASLALDYLIAIRSRLLETYQELMRMQV